MKIKSVDNDLYLDTRNVFFYLGEEIPKRFLDKTKYNVIVIQSKRKEGSINYALFEPNEIKFDSFGSIEEFFSGVKKEYLEDYILLANPPSVVKKAIIQNLK